jgi:hypothetical protein
MAQWAVLEAVKKDCMPKAKVVSRVGAMRPKIKKVAYAESLAGLKGYSEDHLFQKVLIEVLVYLSHRCGTEVDTSLLVTDDDFASYHKTVAVHTMLDAHFSTWPLGSAVTHADVLLSPNYRDRPMVVYTDILRAEAGKAHVVVTSPWLLSQARPINLKPDSPKYGCSFDFMWGTNSKQFAIGLLGMAGKQQDPHLVGITIAEQECIAATDGTLKGLDNALYLAYGARLKDTIGLMVADCSNGIRSDVHLHTYTYTVTPCRMCLIRPHTIHVFLLLPPLLAHHLALSIPLSLTTLFSSVSGPQQRRWAWTMGSTSAISTSSRW